MCVGAPQGPVHRCGWSLPKGSSVGKAVHPCTKQLCREDGPLSSPPYTSSVSLKGDLRGQGTETGRCSPQVFEGVTQQPRSLTTPSLTGPRAGLPAPGATASLLSGWEFRRKALGLRGTWVSARAEGARRCPNKWRKWRPLAGLLGLFAIWPRVGGTVVGVQGGMENSGRKPVAGNGPREETLETPAPGEPPLLPSQHAWLQSRRPPLALPQSQEGKHRCCRGTPWQGPVRQPLRGQVVWTEGSESASHDQPS